MSAWDYSQLAADYSSSLVSNYCFMSGATLFLFDCLITTGDEMRCFWGRKLTGAAVLFWLNKYLTTLWLVWTFITFFQLSDEGCASSSRGAGIIDFLTFPVVAVFTGIRVYALEKSWILVTFTFLLSAVPLGINFSELHFGLTGENITPFGCQTLDNMPMDLVKKLTIVSRSSLIAADCLAIGVTWLTLSRRYDVVQMGALKGTISAVLLVDGTIYFVLLAVLNSLHLTFTLLSLAVSFLQSTSNISNFTTPVTAILISRFLLHLQSANLRAIGMASSQMTTTSYNGSVLFERVVGSLGSSMVPDDYHRRDEDWEDGDPMSNAGGTEATLEE